MCTFDHNMCGFGVEAITTAGPPSTARASIPSPIDNAKFDIPSKIVSGSTVDARHRKTKADKDLGTSRVRMKSPVESRQLL